MTKTAYFRHLGNDRNSIVEAVLGAAGIIFAWFVFIHGVWFLALSMFGFGLFTLKSMNLTRAITIRLHRPGVRTVGQRVKGPEISQADTGTPVGPIQLLRVYSSTIRATIR